MKNRNTWIFLVLMILFYAALYQYKPVLVENALQKLGSLVDQLIPALILVFVLIFISHIVFQNKHVLHIMGKHAGFKGWFIAIFGGIISDGPPYLWYPILRDLEKKGMRKALLATFLSIRAIKIPLLPLMVFYFGWVFTIIFNLYMFVFAIIKGYIVEKLMEWK